MVGVITKDSNLDIIYLDYFFSRLSNYNIIRMTYEGSTIIFGGNLSSSVFSTLDLSSNLYFKTSFKAIIKCLRK